MGCFWGAERKFWQVAGRLHDRRRLRGRLHAEPDLREVCIGHDRAQRGRARRLRSRRRSSYDELLRVFWENHDPTQGMRQGNDVGTQYRSAIYCSRRRAARAAERSRDAYQERSRKAGYGAITTEILRRAGVLLRRGLPPAVPGEEPRGYCGLGGTGVACPVGLAESPAQICRSRISSGSSSSNGRISGRGRISSGPPGSRQLSMRRRSRKPGRTSSGPYAGRTSHLSRRAFLRGVVCRRLPRTSPVAILARLSGQSGPGRARGSGGEFVELSRPNASSRSWTPPAG